MPDAARQLPAVDPAWRDRARQALAQVLLAAIRRPAPAAVPLRSLHLEAPPSVPYSRRAEVEERLRACGFDVFVFTINDAVEFMRGAGWQTHIAAFGYDAAGAECVWFDIVAGQPLPVAFVVGALRKIGGEG